MDRDQALRKVAEDVLAVTHSLCADGTLTIRVIDNAGKTIAETAPPLRSGSTLLGHSAIHQPHTRERVGVVNVTSGATHNDILTMALAIALAMALALQIASRIEDRLTRVLAPAVAGNMPQHTTSRIEELEYNAIMDALVHTHGAITLAATHLGISRSTMYRRLRLYGIAPTAP